MNMQLAISKKNMSCDLVSKSIELMRSVTTRNLMAKMKRLIKLLIYRFGKKKMHLKSLSQYARLNINAQDF